MNVIKCLICFKIVSEVQKDFIQLPGCKDLYHTNCLLKYAEKNEKGKDFNCCPECKRPYDISLIKKTTEQFAEFEVMCCIDHEVYTDARPPYSLPCNHFYHLDCLNVWRKKCEGDTSQQNVCPLCKKYYEENQIRPRPDVQQKLKDLYRESSNISEEQAGFPVLVNVPLIKKKTEELEEGEEICCIDHQPYTHARLPYSLPCNHFYHLDCLNLWRKKCEGTRQQNVCPLCKQYYEKNQIRPRPDVQQKLQGFQSERNNIPVEQAEFPIFVNGSQYLIKPSMKAVELLVLISKKEGVPPEKLKFTVR